LRISSGSESEENVCYQIDRLGVRNLTKRSVPELRIFQIIDGAWASHASGMFEVGVKTPAQFGAFISWLVINRGPLGCFVHPNTGDELRDHIQRYTYLGSPPPINMAKFTLLEELDDDVLQARADLLVGKT
jgi:aromatic ring-cleaving dioxygenase